MPPGPGPAASQPLVRLAGTLIQVADQQGTPSAAVRLAGTGLVHVAAASVASIASGSAVTLDVVVPAAVRTVAAANGTLTTRAPDGRKTARALRAGDLAAASDGSAEPVGSPIGAATVASAMAPGGPVLEVSAIVAAAADPVSTYTSATRQVYVAIATPAGGAANTTTRAQVTTQVAGASSFWSEVSTGGLTLEVAAVSGPYTSAYTCSSYSGMWNEAAARMGLPTRLPANTSLVVEVPREAPGCGYGLGTVGANPNDSGYLYVADDVWPVLAHELGHNMSFQHADALRCTASDSPYSSGSGSSWTGAGCTEQSYGDGQDVMAASLSGSAPYLSAPQSLRRGIIPPSAAVVIDTARTQTVTLLPLAGRTGLRVAEVVDTVTGVTYYVEYRTAAGRDANNVWRAATGVRVLRFNPDTGATVLLDPSPSTATHDANPSLPAGQTFVSYDGLFRVTTLSADASGAQVTIANGTGTTTAPGAPTVVQAAAGNTTATVAWAGPASNGGASVTAYQVSASPGGMTRATAGELTTSFAGLTNGVAYTFTVTATNRVGTSSPSAPSLSVTPTVGARFTAVTPVRLLDTRSGGVAARVGPEATITLALGSQVPATATAVVLNVTAVDATLPSHLTVYPDGWSMPEVSNLNYVKGQTIPNLVTVIVGTSGKIRLFNSGGTVDVIVDLAGFYSSTGESVFSARTPLRLLDTRIGTGLPKGRVGPGQTLTLPVTGLPAGTTTVVLNVTAVDATLPSHLTVFPGRTALPLVSNLNYIGGQTIANLVVVKLGADGTVSMNNSGGTVDLIADLAGSFGPPQNGAGFSATAPQRLLDTRTGTGAPLARLGAGQSLVVTIPGLPASATAVVLNVTAVSATLPSHLTVYPDGSALPTVSNLNYVTGETIPNLVTVMVGPGGKVRLFNSGGTVDLIADLAGYYSP